MVLAVANWAIPRGRDAAWKAGRTIDVAAWLVQHTVSPAIPHDKGLRR